jgi:hypothetical protein
MKTTIVWGEQEHESEYAPRVDAIEITRMINRSASVKVAVCGLLLVWCFSFAVNQEALALKAKQKSGRSSVSASAAGDIDKLQQKALQAYMVRNYAEACKLFQECVKKKPGDASFQYYLAVSALSSNQMEIAEHALCRVVVMTDPASEWGKLAAQALKDWKKQFSSIRPYSQLENGKLMRWDKSQGEIKIWIADGLQLPPGFVGPDLTVDKCRTLYSMFDRPGFFEHLSRVEHYVPSYASIIKEGINDWAWVAAEGIVKFKFVDDPRKADVLYFWCPQSGGDSVGRTYYPWTGVARARCIVHVETEYLRKWGAQTPKQLRQTSAHEFGHVLGLGQHSSESSDVMCGHGVTVSWRERAQYSNISPVTRNDFVTLRALYELPPDDLFLPLAEK